MTEPQDADRFLEYADDPVGTQGIGVVRIVPEGLKETGPGIQAGEAAAVRPHPEDAFRIFENRHYDGAAKAVRIPVFREKPVDLSGVPVNAVEAVFRPHPDVAVAVLEQCTDIVAAQAVPVARLMAVVDESFSSRIHTVDAAAHGADPETTLPVEDQGGLAGPEKGVAAQAGRIVGIVGIGGDAIFAFVESGQAAA